MTNDDATLRQQLSPLRDDITTVRESVAAMKSELIDTKTVAAKAQARMDSVERLLYSNPRERYVGLLERIDNVEKIVETLQDERNAMKQRLTGMMIGLAFTGVTGIGTFGAVVRLIIGGP